MASGTRLYFDMDTNHIRAFKQALTEAEFDLAHMNETNKKIATHILGVATFSTPVRTGRLAHTGRALGYRNTAIIRYGTKSLPYAPVIHWGSMKRQTPPTHIYRNPWAWRSAKAEAGKVQDIYYDAIEHINEEIALKTQMSNIVNGD